VLNRVIFQLKFELRDNYVNATTDDDDVIKCKQKAADMKLYFLNRI